MNCGTGFGGVVSVSLCVCVCVCVWVYVYVCGGGVSCGVYEK